MNKKLLSTILSTALLFTACSNNSEKDKKENPSSISSSEEKKTSKKSDEFKKETKVIDKESVENASNGILDYSDKDSLRAIYVQQLSDSLDGKFVLTSTRENNVTVLKLSPVGETKSAIIAIFANTDEPSMLDAWKLMTDSVLLLSKSFNESVDEDVSVIIPNPTNENNKLYSTLNDKEEYNIVNDL